MQLAAEWDVPLDRSLVSADAVTGVVVGDGILGFSLASGSSWLTILAGLPADSMRPLFRRTSRLQRGDSSDGSTIAPLPLGTSEGGWLHVMVNDGSAVESFSTFPIEVPALVLHDQLEGVPAVCNTGDTQFEVIPRLRDKAPRRLVNRGQGPMPRLAESFTTLPHIRLTATAIARGDGQSLCVIVDHDSATAFSTELKETTRFALRGRPCEDRAPVIVMGLRLWSRWRAVPCDATATSAATFVLHRAVESTARDRSGSVIDAYGADGELMQRLQLPYSVKHIVAGYGRIYALRQVDRRVRLTSFVLPLVLRTEQERAAFSPGPSGEARNFSNMVESR